MTAPAAKKNRKVLLTSDSCPRACNSGPNTATHLVSDHVEEQARQCTKCNCVLQDVNDPKASA